MRYSFACLVVTISLAAGSVPGLAEEEMEPPFPALPPVLALEGLSVTSAVAECSLAQTIIEGKVYLPGLIILGTCIEDLRDPERKAHYLHVRGELLEHIRAYSRAIDDFERALELQPENVTFAVSLGRVWLTTDEDERALAIFRSTLRLAPGNADVLSGLGTGLFKLGDVTRASAFIARALDLDPDHVPALRDRGLIFLQSGAANRAIEDFDQALRGDPERPELILYRGMARRRLGEAEAALGDFNKAAELDPDSPRILVNRGLLLGEMDRTQEAFADFAEAIDINPGTADAWYGRGLLAARLGDGDTKMMERARSDLKQAITLDPDNRQLGAAMAVLARREPEEKKRRY